MTMLRMMSTTRSAITALVTLLLTNTIIGNVNAHLYFDFPAPRSCFYGGYWGTDGDGPWRRSPCDREPGSATATFTKGSSACLSVHEFVAHPAHYDIQLFTKPVGPGDDDYDDQGGIFLKEKMKDTAPSDGETGYQRFWIDLPQNVTCEGTCTIQIRQYAKDFDWYYYACVDVNIVADDEGEQADTSPSLSQDQCVWEPAPSRIRAQILQTIVLGSVFLVDAILVIGWCCWSMRAMKKRADEKPENGGDSESPETTAETNNSGSWGSRFRQATRQAPYKTVLYGILAWMFLSSIAVAIALVGLKSCWF